jgi:hypothetical protein
MDFNEACLGETALLIWGVILDDARVSVPSDVIGEKTGLSMTEVDDAIEDLRAAGMVSVWSRGEGPLVTLSPWSVSRLGLRIHRARWVGIGDPAKRDRIHNPIGVDGACVEWMADPKQLDPSEVAEAREEASAILDATSKREGDARAGGRRFRRTDNERNPDRLPYPTVLLSGVQVWPPQADYRWDFISPVGTWVRTPTRHCPVCRGRKLWSSAYCLWCDRWGLGWVLSKITRDSSSRPAAKSEAKFKPKRKSGAGVHPERPTVVSGLALLK